MNQKFSQKGIPRESEFSAFGITLADLVVRPRDLNAIFELRTPNKKRSRD